MPALASPCPTADRLKAFALGLLDGAEADSLGNHVSSCNDCADSLVNASDQLLEALRAVPRVAGDLPKGTAVESAIQRACRLHNSRPAVKNADTSAGSLETGHSDATPFAPENNTARLAAELLSPPQSPDEIGRLGGYRVLKLLNSGGMGIVFLAEDSQLQRRVALKVMQPLLATSQDARQRFLREARAAAALRHGNIITIYQVGEDHGTPWLAMELLEGESLGQRLNRVRRLPLMPAVRIGRQIAHALAAAHASGLIHRDIKPDNIWLETQARIANEVSSVRVKVLDFGLARAQTKDSRLTEPGVVVGTPAYMAPEQARGEVVDHRCDLFSLGCVLYHMLAGNSPFHRKDTLAVLTALIEHSPPSLNSIGIAVPNSLDDLIAKLLAKNPTSRPQSATEIAKTLAGIDSQVNGSPPMTNAVVSAEPPSVLSLTYVQLHSVIARLRAWIGKTRNSRRLITLAAFAGIGALFCIVHVLSTPQRTSVAMSEQKGTTNEHVTESKDLGATPMAEPNGPSIANRNEFGRSDQPVDGASEPSQAVSGDQHRPPRGVAELAASDASGQPHVETEAPPASEAGPIVAEPQNANAAKQPDLTISAAETRAPGAIIPAAKSQDAKSPVLVALVTMEPISKVWGEVTRENETQLEVLDFMTGELQTFAKTNLKTIRKSISEQSAIEGVGLPNYMACKIKKVLPFAATGKIAQLDGGVAFVSLGRNVGLEIGKELVVYRGETEIKDPDTGVVLGKQRRKIARLEAISVEDKLSKAKLIGDLEIKLEVGDIVEQAVVNNVIAIFPLVVADGSETLGTKRIAEELTTGLVKRGVRVVERRLLDKVRGELGLQQGIAFDPAMAQQIGNQVGAYGIIVGTVSPKNKFFEVQLRLVKVETSEILVVASQTFRDVNLFGARPPVPTVPNAGGHQ